VRFAVALSLDHAADAAVRALSRQLDPTCFPGLTSSGELHAHISLAACDGLDVGQFRPVLAQFAAETPSLPCTLASLGVFPTEEGVIFLAPTASRVLIDVQEQVVGRLGQCGAQVEPYWIPGNWVPHCTLAIGIPRELISTAVGVCHAVFRPISGQLTQVSLFKIGPVHPCYAFDLRPAER
jgi:2'-5' RNA ligase